MPMRLEGSCRCGAVKFSVDSHAPQPCCYCTICRKTAGVFGVLERCKNAVVTSWLQVLASLPYE